MQLPPSTPPPTTWTHPHLNLMHTTLPTALLGVITPLPHCACVHSPTLQLMEVGLEIVADCSKHSPACDTAALSLYHTLLRQQRPPRPWLCLEGTEHTCGASKAPAARNGTTVGPSLAHRPQESFGSTTAKPSPRSAMVQDQTFKASQQRPITFRTN